VKTWRKRWLVLHDNFIAYYRTSGDTLPQGCLQIDQKFSVNLTGRMIIVANRTRKLSLFASTPREALEWAEAMNSFYQTTARRLPQLMSASFPPRPAVGVKLYCCGKEYFSALALALLQAQEEILIASWMVSPTLLLTHPPLPPIRLDQLLKYKAEAGVKIYVLLYKEVYSIYREDEVTVTVRLSDDLLHNPLPTPSSP
jgi:phosphatidylserine/phosphatidylglycerophosphate/cardiolipin synthase-like enzyme